MREYDIRNKVYIADKLPAFLVSKPAQIEKYFATQLARLGTDYIDYYLMHMLMNFSDWEKLKSFGILEFIEQKRKSGQIKYVGFSFHGRAEEFIKILEDYCWDFCQIQYNYLDQNYQAGKAGLERAYSLGVGVVVMEPLRGGALAIKAPTKVNEIFASYKEKRSAAYWSLRFIMNHPGVGTVLSGMNELAHIEDNINAASATAPNSMTAEELQIVEDVKGVYEELMRVPCTGCNYCMPCPFGVDIPATFADYNSKYFFGKGASIQYISRHVGITGERSGVNLCTNCGKCKQHCPQNIDIPPKLQEAHKELDNVLLRVGASIAAKVLGTSKKRKA